MMTGLSSFTVPMTQAPGLGMRERRISQVLRSAPESRPSIRAMTRGIPHVDHGLVICSATLPSAAAFFACFCLASNSLMASDVGGRTFGDVEHRNLELGGRLFQLGFDPVHMSERVEARHGLDAAHVRADARLGDDLDEADFGGIGNMASAAQLAGELARLDDAHDIAVFFAEQARDARFAGGVEGRFVDGGGA